MNDGYSVQHMTQSALGRYRLVKRIGVGGMGEVWLGEDPALHRQVAIKTLPLQNQNDNEFLQRFEREARAAAALNHPHILPVHDFGRQTLPDGQTITYIVMPYVGGGSLADRIQIFARNNTLMPPGEALAFLSQAANAIDYAHAQGVLHRDIKPANMLLRNDNWLLLADFGIARILTERTQLTKSGEGFGTPDYMAPEQAQGKAEPASDNYSLAVITYQLFTGRLPFNGDTSYAIAIQHIITPPPPPRRFNSAIPSAVEQLLLQGLAKNPAQRPPSARAFVDALQQAMRLAPYAPTLARPTSTMPAMMPNTERPFATQAAPGTSSETRHGLTRRKVLIGGGAALLIAGGLGTWAITSIGDRSTTNQPQITRTATGKAKSTATHTSPSVVPNSPNFLLTGHDQPATSLAWSPNAPVLASTGLDGTVKLWNILAIQQQGASTSQAQASVSPGTVSNNMYVAWSPDGKYLAIGNVNGGGNNFNTVFLSIYDSNLRNSLPNYTNLSLNGNNFLNGFAWNPGKLLLVPFNSSGSSTCTFGILDMQNTTKNIPTTTLSLFMSLDSNNYYLNPLAYSPDGTQVAIGTTQNVVVGQFSLPAASATQDGHDTGRSGWQQKAVLTLDSRALEADTVTWSPDGRFVAATGTNADAPPSILMLWDLKSAGNLRQTLNIPGSGSVLGTLAWSPAPTSGQLAAGNKDGTIFLWNLQLNQNVPAGNTYPVKVLHGPNAPVQALAWSSDGLWLAASYKDINDSIAIWRQP